ncbi:MAG: hypothetical protein WC399_04635 [Bacilli bacterium]|jgi:hypothetical protein
MKRRGLIKFGLITTLLAASASVIAFTYAAYLNYDKYIHPLDMNTTSLSTHFASGSGTETSPYLIANSTQLRNLQKLTMLGVFRNNAHFALQDSFTWDNTDGALLPIGTEDNPFYGTFDGRGRTISNLIVNGANTNDVGMFGYVAMEGLIRNLVLSAPTIYLTENDGEAADKTKRTVNPLDDYLLTYAQALTDIDLVSSTSSSATFLVPETTVSISLGGSVEEFEIVYESTNANLLYESAPGYWTTLATPGSVNPATDLYPVQLSARVFAIFESQVISYTLERWQINVKGNGTVTDDAESIFKTIHPTDGEHETYVGIFVGHLDGGASYLGLWGGNEDSASANGKIVVNGRAARSFNVLVGRSRTDNPLDATAANYYNRFINFNDVLNNNPAMRTTLWSIPQTPLRSEYLTHQNNAISATQSYGLTADETDYFRVYPRIQNTATTFDAVQDNGTITTGKPYSGYAIRFQHAASGSTITTDGRLGASVRATSQSGTYYRRNFNVLNGFWLWSTDKINSRAEDVFGLNEFEVSLNISYVATTTSFNNKFQILWNTYNPDAVYKILWFTWEANKVYNASWSDLSAQTTEVDGVTVPIYSPNEHPLITQLTPTRTSSGVIQETSINFVVNREDGGFWEGIFDYILLNEPYYPMFAFGVGKNGTYATDAYVQQSIGGTTYRFYDGRYAVDNYTLDILSIELLFTAREGNVSNLLNNVDFLYSLPTYTNNPDGTTTFTAWNKASKVKIQFNVEDPTQNASGTTYRFWREAGFSGVNSYVHGLYTTGTNYAPFNTVGYDNAELDPGNA